MNVILGGAPNSDQSEQFLLAGLKAKEERAIDAVYHLFNTPLFFFTYKLTNNQQESEDIVTQCFCDLWEKESDFTTMAKLKTCLFVYARNRSYNYLKSKAIRKLKESEVISLLDKPEPTVLNDIIHAEMITALFDAVQTLPEKQRTVIMQVVIEGKTAAEVAKEMGLSISDVRESKRRGLEKIRSTHQHLSPSLLPFLLTLCKLHS